MISQRSVVAIGVIAVLVGVLLTALPLFWHVSPLWEFLAWPGSALSGLCGANDKWGLPDLPLYLLGGTVFWAVVCILLSAIAVFLRHWRRL